MVTNNTPYCFINISPTFHVTLTSTSRIVYIIFPQTVVIFETLAKTFHICIKLNHRAVSFLNLL